jgi:2-amino-4-hydroxy-6-hydroxymethyldihydropteridine diphosphokinase
MAVIYLLLGTNLGDRSQNLALCTGMLENEAGKVICRSDIYESEPWGFDHPNWFLNQVLVMDTGIEPQLLMEALLKIENRMGRERNETTYAARTIDIDILLYNRLEMNDDHLILPHPRIGERRFTLIPLVEIDPSLLIPGTGLNVWQLLRSCKDKGIVRPFIGER